MIKSKKGFILLDLVVGKVVGAIIILLVLTTIIGLGGLWADSFVRNGEKLNLFKFQRFVTEDLSERFNPVVISDSRGFTVNNRRYEISNGRLFRIYRDTSIAFGSGNLVQNAVYNNHLEVTFNKRRLGITLNLGRFTVQP